MAKAKEVQQLTRARLLELNGVLSAAKVKGLEQQPYIALLTLKVKLSSLAEEADKARAGAVRAALQELGYREGESLPADKAGRANALLTGVVEKLLSEEVALETRVLTADELFSSLLSIPENDGLTADQKATLLQYLMK